MSLSILIDMNLSLDWATYLTSEGFLAVHWSQIGDPRADDLTIARYAESNQFVVFTHDLDFGTILALSHKSGPSVVLLRSRDVMPPQAGPFVVTVLRLYETDLTSGALVVIDEPRHRVRILPI